MVAINTIKETRSASGAHVCQDLWLSHLLHESQSVGACGIYHGNTVVSVVCSCCVNVISAFQVAGFSIPASEHSTITSWGPGEEEKAFKNMLTQFPTGLVACTLQSASGSIPVVLVH